MNGEPAKLRDVMPGDLELLLRFVRALAEYGRLSHEVQASEEDFRRALFGLPLRAAALIAEVGAEPAGFALWFYNFSTFEGRPGLFVEDVFVEPRFRGRGIGRQIFHALARRALAEGCARMEWCVHDWNEKAIHFYQSLGARPMTEWTVQRLSGHALATLAE